MVFRYWWCGKPSLIWGALNISLTVIYSSWTHPTQETLPNIISAAWTSTSRTASSGYFCKADSKFLAATWERLEAGSSRATCFMSMSSLSSHAWCQGNFWYAPQIIWTLSQHRTPNMATGTILRSNFSPTSQTKTYHGAICLVPICPTWLWMLGATFGVSRMLLKPIQWDPHPFWDMNNPFIFHKPITKTPVNHKTKNTILNCDIISPNKKRPQFPWNPQTCRYHCWFLPFEFRRIRSWVVSMFIGSILTGRWCRPVLSWLINHRVTILQVYFDISIFLSWSIHPFIHLSVYLSICLSVYLPTANPTVKVKLYVHQLSHEIPWNSPLVPTISWSKMVV